MSLLIVVALLIAMVLAGVVRARMADSRVDDDLGSMSAQWLAEYRAMHSS